MQQNQSNAPQRHGPNAKTPIMGGRQNTINISKPSFASSVQTSLASTSDSKKQVEIRHGTHLGKPAVFFSAEDYFVNLAEDCKWTIVGKFTKGRPNMEEMRKLFISQFHLKGPVKIAYKDHKCVYIDFNNEVDYNHIYLKPYLVLGGHHMKILKWTADFKPEVETSIVPVWLLIHQLPWHLFRWEIVSRMISAAGHAIAHDQATYSKSRGNVAKVKVEIDLLKPRLNELWLGFKRLDGSEDGEWLQIEYEDVPSYCNYCKLQGHNEIQCWTKARDERIKKQREEVQSNPVFPIQEPIVNSDGFQNVTKKKGKSSGKKTVGFVNENMVDINTTQNPKTSSIQNVREASNQNDREKNTSGTQENKSLNQETNNDIIEIRVPSSGGQGNKITASTATNKEIQEETMETTSIKGGQIGNATNQCFTQRELGPVEVSVRQQEQNAKSSKSKSVSKKNPEVHAAVQKSHDRIVIQKASQTTNHTSQTDHQSVGDQQLTMSPTSHDSLTIVPDSPSEEGNTTRVHDPGEKFSDASNKGKEHLSSEDEDDDDEYESIEGDTSSDDQGKETTNKLVEPFSSQQSQEELYDVNVDQEFGDITEQHHLSPRGVTNVRGRGGGRQRGRGGGRNSQSIHNTGAQAKSAKNISSSTFHD
ncbi:hypothetical protein A4A49_35610 [Nicotiana attenuata]|uniref:DUF4283 domain-containing protein n=1 Tax=Nicotiana attenuata TaxID=49451 RepID=A0A1J6KHV8_NICAT|nr:hypothetical protein A4A49_35610 [Nicotiana attenuata]